ncbi:MAG: dUTP diphosphatase [Lachnospiraceae bacterium]|nr:dUTP diphosphatase [Lachnospiraceae bacterium]
MIIISTIYHKEELTMRGFEVLSEHQDQINDLCTELGLDSWIPRRSTTKSAGYDLRTIEEVTILPGQIKIIGTGLTAYMQDDEELQIRCRSGLAAKMGAILANGVGTVDSDYYGKHICVMLRNIETGPMAREIHLNAGDRIAQAVFSKYLIIDADDPVDKERTGGFGSTGIK